MNWDKKIRETIERLEIDLKRPPLAEEVCVEIGMDYDKFCSKYKFYVRYLAPSKDIIN